MSSPAPTTTNQVITTINSILQLGSFTIPAVITLWKGWQQSAGKTAVELFDESDVELDQTIKETLLREAAMGFPTA